jgi:hypothetical protein
MIAQLFPYFAGGLLVAMLAVIAWALWDQWRRVFADEGPLRLAPMMRRRGAAPPQALAEGEAEALARAALRCTVCRDKASCDAWLASGARDGYQRFCPNAGFIERARREAPQRGA